ncbi:hypothetical protein HOLleu_35642 [Holothuria leucospilota]|uniref:Uncharacterized protein n=1 Tax=Holothuria leucospilota TaxID=206669 RepID=A0A9Q0YIS1_HOLLE|nr:hypothetical protein HOLleu_35642 [Holothuria leucospilota]
MSTDLLAFLTSTVFFVWSIRGFHHLNMHFGPRRDTKPLHARRIHETTLKRLAQTRSDIIFLSNCKKLDIVPKGLRVRNPLNHTSSKGYVSKAQRICDHAYLQLRNQALKAAYCKQSELSALRDESSSTLQNVITDVSPHEVFGALNACYRAHFRKCMQRKNDKLDRIRAEDRVLKHLDHTLAPTSNIILRRNRSRHTSTRQTNIANLSNYTLSNGEQRLLSRGLSFCPSRDLNPVGLCQDMEQYLRRIKLKEYFQNDDTNSSPKPH